ncbi:MULTISPECIES: hypothetical protein [unclassified Streptomyces]|uniref:hypothetical protein n=1 Tax=unclassified Streptomyces TaxID=2593676 RepID=UPI001BEAE76E|nr:MULTISPECIES: hypothetical protein [unclassified Streptomyces]MBT2408080.1 hypothetical protein [Streptomyces sp. ISL-21]MBT2455781.1 hypothetical protein [Streptomyces sp. ISL-86]MBT2609530.1 hypothetical protein [Streptomyces sp. ISL-87]
MRSAVVEMFAWWAGLVGVTVVSITSPGPVELAVACAAASAGAFMAYRVRRAADVRLRGTTGALRALALLPLAAVRGCGVLVRVLARRQGHPEHGAGSAGCGCARAPTPAGPGSR